MQIIGKSRLNRNTLITELDLLRNEVKTAEFVNPKSIIRIDEIKSILLSEGETEKLVLTPSKPKKYKKGLNLKKAYSRFGKVE